MEYANVREIFGWIRRWKSVPVLSWTSAASHFSKGMYSLAAREYQRGLDSYPNHKVASYARLDLAVCLERLGVYDRACDHLLPIASSPGPLQQLARIQLCFTLLLSDRADEAAKIAALLKFDVKPVRSSRNSELLTVKALTALEGLRKFQRLPDTDRDKKLPSSAITANTRIEDLKPYRTIHDLVGAVVELTEGETSAEQMIAAAEAKQTDGLWLWVIAGQRLLEMKEGARARRLLNRALALEPRSPKILNLLARTYLISGEGYSPTFAVQLATKACQHAGWKSVSSHAALAECFYHSGDKLAALTVVQGSRSKLADPQIQLLLESLSDQLAS